LRFMTRRHHTGPQTPGVQKTYRNLRWHRDIIMACPFQYAPMECKVRCSNTVLYPLYRRWCVMSPGIIAIMCMYPNTQFRAPDSARSIPRRQILNKISFLFFAPFYYMSMRHRTSPNTARPRAFKLSPRCRCCVQCGPWPSSRSCRARQRRCCAAPTSRTSKVSSPPSCGRPVPA